MRIEHDYGRGGALAYLAACDVHREQVTGRCEDTTGIAPFARLVEQVMSTEPYASAGRVSWIVDNGSSHRGAASAAFETRYNAIAQPFTWKFSRADLRDLLRRIDAHDKNQPHALAA